VFDHGLSSASEVTTLWRYTNLFIIIIIIIYLRAHGLRKVDEQSAYTPHVTSIFLNDIVVSRRLALQTYYALVKN